MKKRFSFASIFCLLCMITCTMPVEASFMDVLDTINTAGRTINTINSAGRSTMSTVEYAQRFTDRQQDRKDQKRAQKDYNENAEAEYYRTLQETRDLKQQYYNSNL